MQWNEGIHAFFLSQVIQWHSGWHGDTHVSAHMRLGDLSWNPARYLYMTNQKKCMCHFAWLCNLMHVLSKHGGFLCPGSGRCSALRSITCVLRKGRQRMIPSSSSGQSVEEAGLVIVFKPPPWRATSNWHSLVCEPKVGAGTWCHASRSPGWLLSVCAAVFARNAFSGLVFGSWGRWAFALACRSFFMRSVAFLWLEAEMVASMLAGCSRAVLKLWSCCILSCLCQVVLIPMWISPRCF